jgi:hypothetical protein
MVLVTQDTMGGLGAGIQSLGGSLGQVLQQRGEKARKKQSGNLIQQAIDEASADPMTGTRRELSPTNLVKALSEARAKGALDEDISTFSNIYKNILGAEKKGIFQQEDPEALKTTLLDLGMDEDTASSHASLYEKLSTGGKTSYGQFLIDQLQRGMLGGPKGQPLEQQQIAEEKIVAPGESETLIEEEFSFPDIDPFGGAVTPKERVKIQSELFKDNVKYNEEITKSFKSSKGEGRSIRQLNRLNDGGKLPENFKSALTVDLKTGDLRVSPKLQNAETQLFVKTINEFVRKARDSFGARVTNFELEKFLQGLPTLANSEEGRRLILEQMDVVNKLNQLETESLKKVYKKYGTRGIDRKQADDIAEEMRAPKEEELMKRFDRVDLKQDAYDLKKTLPEGNTLVLYNGKIIGVKNEQLEVAKSKGAEVL